MSARTWQVGDTVVRSRHINGPKQIGVITRLTDKTAKGEPVGYIDWGKGRRKPLRSVLYPLINLSDEERQRGKAA